MKHAPNRGVLMNNESELIIACASGHLCKFNISNPTAPLLINTIQI